MDEEDIIQRYFAPLAAGAPGAFGLLDDAAALACAADSELVITTDTLIGGVHFFSDDAADDIAAKALGVNLSDLAAKAADPLVYTLSLALPGNVSSDWLESFAAGLEEMQGAHNISLTGGDTTRSPGPLMISMTAIGTAPAGQMLRRAGARTGDLLYVTGTLGDAALGLLLRRGEAACKDWPVDAEARSHLLARYARPRPRTGFADALRAHAHAALDISDGLVLDATRLCRASGVTATIDAEQTPLSAASRQLAADPQWLEVILTGGDDYELLIAAPPEAADPLSRAAAEAGIEGVTTVGEITAASPDAAQGTPVKVVDGSGVHIRLARPGYTHFG